VPRGEQFARYYPGLIPIEQALWRAFLVSHETEYDAFEYNVFVGRGVTAPPRVLDGDPALQAKLTQRFKEATQKKIDVVATQGAVTWIFEVHERAGAQSLGQLLLYEQLLVAGRPGLGQVELALVTRRLAPDVLPVFQEQGVRVFQVTLSA
jgi:hypothetical protein